MRIYLEPSVLVKLFKREEQESERMMGIVSRVDEGHAQWGAYTSDWSLLEVARALRKQGKPKELIDLDLKALRGHKISFQAISSEILYEAEKIIVRNNVYASDSIHAATFLHLKRGSKIDAFVTDDRHFFRLKDLVNPLRVRDVTLQ